MPPPTHGAAAQPSTDAKKIRQENERLRDDNVRLRAAVAAVRPATPLPESTPRGGPQLAGAADALLYRMQEGADLLREREVLEAEHAWLAGEGDYDEFQGLGCATHHEDHPCSSSEVPAGEAVDPEFESLDRLLPLLSEGDALQAEREELRSERQELLAAIQESGITSDINPGGVDAAAFDRDLEFRIRQAVEDVTRENDSLEAEIAKLRNDNGKLREHKASVDTAGPARSVAIEEQPALPVKTNATGFRSAYNKAKSPTLAAPIQRLSAKTASQPASSESKQNIIDFEDDVCRREAMSTLLRSQLGGRILREPLQAVFPRQEQPVASKPPKADYEDNVIDAEESLRLRHALHTLYRGFAR